MLKVECPECGRVNSAPIEGSFPGCDGIDDDLKTGFNCGCGNLFNVTYILTEKRSYNRCEICREYEFNCDLIKAKEAGVYFCKDCIDKSYSADTTQGTTAGELSNV